MRGWLTPLGPHSRLGPNYLELEWGMCSCTAHYLFRLLNRGALKPGFPLCFEQNWRLMVTTSSSAGYATGFGVYGVRRVFAAEGDMFIRVSSSRKEWTLSFVTYLCREGG